VARSLRDAGKLGLRQAFEFAQRRGLDVLPRHFYSEIPDIAALRNSTEWRRPHSMVGVNGADPADQLTFAAECCSPEVRERLGHGMEVYDWACAENGAVGYGPAEAMFLYCFIASQRPSRVVQVGAGVSTAIMLRAAREAEHDLQVVCVDPYPTKLLEQLASAGSIDLVARPAQLLSPAFLGSLESGDLLFVDSSHTVKPGSEVNHIVLEVLPRLSSGVFVHFHDVRFPYNYSPRLLYSDLFFWNESTLVQAFLVHNARARMRVSLSMLHHNNPAGLQALLPAYRPAQFTDGLVTGPTEGAHYPSALYMQTC
jgi:predicted O-methyltransferase YrrM